MNKKDIISSVFKEFPEVRYMALYINEKLVSEQRDNVSENSSQESDRYEELLVNPTVLKLTSQRGNIDCGGLDCVIIGYGNFYQIVKPLSNGHMSICIEKTSDLNALPYSIFNFVEERLLKF